jgi:uncharacterized protein (TIGR03118 family)
MSKLQITAAACAFLSIASSAYPAAASGYVETTLVTDVTDPNHDLVNPWGISLSPTSPFWISDNGTGKATLYNSAGVKQQGLVVSMPAGSFNVTGQVFNGTAGNFHGDAFVFATENGTITGWRGALGSTAETLFTVAGAIYKGLAISTAKDTLYGANFKAGTIDVFSSAGLTASFSDPTVPAGYAPFNVQNVNGKLYVTYALRGATGDDVAGAGHGYVSVFDPVAHTFSRLVSQGVLDSPWGLAFAPTTFGALSGDLLVGNFGDGTINAFNPLNGTFLATLSDGNGTPLVNDGLWGLIVGNGGSGGSLSSLYITAGPNGETGGLFARIDAVPEPSTILLGTAGFAILAWRRLSSNRRINRRKKGDIPGFLSPASTSAAQACPPFFADRPDSWES